jgi:hypothetical protein
MATYVSNRTAVIARIEQRIKQLVTGAGAEYERILQEQFRLPKTGRIYGEETDVVFNRKTADGLKRVKFVANRGRQWRDGKRNAGMHRASAPGEAPAIKTAALRKGVSRATTRLGPMRWRVVIGESVQSGRGAPTGTSNRSIAHMLEFGTTTMKPRPSWRTALTKLKAGYRVVSRKKKG